jgi:hypothetical protein
MKRPLLESIKRSWASLVITSNKGDLVALLTLVLLMQYGHDYWYVRTPVVVCCIAGLVYRKVATTYLFWLVIAGLVNSANFHNWYSVDNHKYLLGYWCIALVLAFAAPHERQDDVLKLSARWLIAGCMVFALGWKVASPSFRDGSFFEFTLITDGRFHTVARWFGHLRESELAENAENLRILELAHSSGYELQAVQLRSSAEIKLLARALTWWTYLIEGSLAIAYLLPTARSIELARSWLLILFCLTTYAVATVPGFGWLLAIMGVAQLSDGRGRTTTAFVFTILILQFYMLPFGAVINSFS